MKRILMRAGTSPFENLSAADILLSDHDISNFGNNAIGNNNGNMLYAYSVMRVLMKSEDYIIDADHYMHEAYIASDEEIEYVNSHYDLYVVPLANAFRHKFRFALRRLTDFIRRIDIPVVVIGIGVGKIDDVERNKEIIEDFIKAVLEKSALIGVRGERTLDALSKIGFREDQEVTAIGCPSAYTFGPTVRVREPEIGRFRKILFNDNRKAKEQVHQFLYRSMARRKNAWFLPQMIDELKELYLGVPTESAKDSVQEYPATLEHPYFRSGKAKFFVNIPSWLEFASDAGLSIGARMHGNVIPLLSGVPSLFIAIDSRMTDMVQYHHYPYIKQKDINDKTRLEDLLEKTDYSEFYRHQKRNFEHYVDFLRANKVPSIFDAGMIPGRGEAPFDRKIQAMSFQDGVSPITVCSKGDMLARYQDYYPRESEMLKSVRGQARNHIRSCNGEKDG